MWFYVDIQIQRRRGQRLGKSSERAELQRVRINDKAGLRRFWANSSPSGCLLKNPSDYRDPYLIITNDYEWSARRRCVDFHVAGYGAERNLDPHSLLLAGSQKATGILG